MPASLRDGGEPGRRPCIDFATDTGGLPMLTWAIIALVVALIAGALGFTGVAAAAGTVAKILFGLFLAIAIILFVLSLLAVA
jgi:uncharacterized membrane protein YtjA (UPF0391 family)